MKMRLEIDFKIGHNKSEPLKDVQKYMYIESSILMKYISYVIINGKKYIKPKSDSREIQNFYGFIEKNQFEITEIMSSDGRHYFLKDRKYHSYNTYCYYRPGVCVLYAINSLILSKKQERTFKINIIKEKIKK